MYPPPPSHVIRQIERQDIDSICFGKYSIHLHFEGGDLLTFSAPFRFGKTSNLAHRPILEFPLDTSDLMRILGYHVSDSISDEDGTLTLVFSSGDSLVVYANDPMYEAYTLTIHGREYII